MSDFLVTPWTVSLQASLSFPGKNTGVAVISFSRGSFWPRDQTYISCLGSEFFITEPPREALIRDYAMLQKHYNITFGLWLDLSNLWVERFYYEFAKVYHQVCSKWLCSLTKRWNIKQKKRDEVFNSYSGSILQLPSSGRMIILCSVKCPLI